MKCVAIISLVLLCMDSAPVPSWTTSATVVRVIDGDTIDVEVRRIIRIRLLDCWAPETHIDSRLPVERQASEKRAGIASKQNLTDVCEGRSVIVQIPNGDRFAESMTMGRLLGNVWLTETPDKSLSEIQVEGGFATITKRTELQ